MPDTPPSSSGGESGPRVKRVTSSEAVRRKKGLGSRFKNVFIQGSARGAGQYAVENVVVPAIRDLLADSMHAVVDNLFQGGGPPRRRPGTTNPGATPPKINYGGYSTGDPSPTASSRGRTMSQGARARHDFGEILIPNRIEAMEVIEQMYDVLGRYGSVRVADLYELTGVQSHHTDQKWGWTNLKGAKPVRLRNGGFLLDLPEPEELGR